MERKKLDFREIFEWDGTLRDIYVLHTRINDWQRLLDFLHSSGYSTEFYIDRQKQEKLTSQSSDLFDDETQTSRLIKVNIGNLVLHSHCFTKSEIEFDLDPKDVNDEETADNIFQFMKYLGQYLGMSVRLTPDNIQESALVEYHPEQ